MLALVDLFAVALYHFVAFVLYCISIFHTCSDFLAACLRWYNCSLMIGDGLPLSVTRQ